MNIIMLYFGSRVFFMNFSLFLGLILIFYINPRIFIEIQISMKNGEQGSVTETKARIGGKFPNGDEGKGHVPTPSIPLTSLYRLLFSMKKCCNIIRGDS